MRNRKTAYVYGVSAVLLWSTVASAFKLTLRYTNPLSLVFYSSLFSTAILGLVLVIQRKARLLAACSSSQYRRSALLGFLNPFAYYTILFKAYDLLPAQEAQPLNYTWALVLPLLSVPLLHQRLGLRDIAALAVGYAGVVVISTRGDVLGLEFSDPLGVALALVSAFVWGVYWIYNTSDDRDPVVCLFLSFAFALPLTAGACAIWSGFAIDARGLLGTAYTGAFEMSVTFVLWLFALRAAPNTAAVSTLIFIAPFFSLVFIHLLVGEAILPSTIAGLAMIVGALILQKIRRAR